jgi:hypothetical protein
MKRILASLLILLGPMAFAPKASATTGASLDPRPKPLTFQGAPWVSDIDYLLSQDSGDSDATKTAENASTPPPVHVRRNATKKSTHVRAHSHRSSATVQTRSQAHRPANQ